MDGKQARVGIGLVAGDMVQMVHFYRDILGLRAKWDGGDFAAFETGSGELALFMYRRQAFVQALGEPYLHPQGINQTFELALWLASFGEVDDEYRRLSKLGVQFPMGGPQTFSFGIRNFYVADPEGNLIEIGSTMEA